MHLRNWGLSALALVCGAIVVSAANAEPPEKSQGVYHKAVCPHGNPHDTARCHARVVTDEQGVEILDASPNATGTAPSGYGPADLRAAYNITTNGTTTVAIVDAYGYTNAERDLGVYRTQYGLPACTTANGCFSKVNQRGAASPLPPDIGWDVEVALDLDMVSAACPHCHVLLVEADDQTFDDLGASVNTAVSHGAKEISNSYGATEQNGMQAFEADYSHPGVAIVASSGDSGYGIPSFPAVFSSVIAAGGTTLNQDSNARGWSETAWNGAGSGCSSVMPKPSWQKDSGCGKRSVADVSAVADPNTGVAVFVQGGWQVFGGTSVASPIIA